MNAPSIVTYLALQDTTTSESINLMVFGACGVVSCIVLGMLAAAIYRDWARKAH
jgi:hypothetical protein